MLPGSRSTTTMLYIVSCVFLCVVVRFRSSFRVWFSFDRFCYVGCLIRFVLCVRSFCSCVLVCSVFVLCSVIHVLVRFLVFVRGVLCRCSRFVVCRFVVLGVRSLMLLRSCRGWFVLVYSAVVFFVLCFYMCSLSVS